MRYLSLTSTLLLLIVFAAGCSEEAAPTAALLDAASENPTEAPSKNGVVHHASLGGADICEALGFPTGCDANFSLVANMKADGSVTGQWQDTFAGGAGGVHIAIDCLNVDGNGAVVGGVITHGNVGGVDVSGQRAVTAVVDNGTSNNETPDQMSFSIFPAADAFGTDDCTAITLDDFTALGWLFDLHIGQVKVW